LFEHLLGRYGDTEKILKADRHSLMSIDGMTESLAESIGAAADRLGDAASYVNDLKSRDINAYSRFDPEYSELLFELNDPPPVLYVRGRLPEHGKKTVTLIGTSSPREHGIQLTTTLVQRFAEADVQVVSTLRGGIDAAAHLGARAASGKSFAVIDRGFDRIVEPEHVPLAIDIAAEGGVISEYRPDREADATTLVESNRLVVGLSHAVVVTEVYGDSPNTLDLLSFCRMIGKLTFFMIDPAKGAHADERSLARAMECGAIPMQGYEKVNDIINALV
jgi:DNA processing protein